MRVVFLGTAEFGVPALHALVRAGHPVVAAISQPDRPAGRGRSVRPTPIHAAAVELGLHHIQTDDANTLDLMDALGQAEIGVVAAFGQKIGSGILAALPRGCVNLHGSLLPKYRGAAPIQWAVINGDETTGVTVFQLNEHWDAGPIWSQRETEIRETETADELHDRLAELATALIVDTLRDIESGTVRPRAQDPTLASRAPKLSKADGAVDWSQAAPRVARRIHGLWSWPAAACLFASRSGKQERVLLVRAEVADEVGAPTPDRSPGAFCTDLTLQTGAGRVRLLEVQPAGGKQMAFADFANGRRIAPPDRLLPAQ